MKLRKATRFSKLYLNKAFHQLELDPESRYIRAFQTEDCIKRYKRLLLGIKVPPEESQYALQTLLADIENAVNTFIVFGKSDDEHDDGLNKVLKRLAENNITLNIKKCEFDKESVEYHGYVWSKDGMKPAPNKIESLKNVVHLIDSVRNFLGLTNYLNQFIPNYSTLTYPLRALTKKNSDFIWTGDCEKTFDPLKNILTSDSRIQYFDEKKPVILYCDASPVGISAVLLQQIDGKDPNVIAYSSRSLSDAEKRSSQIERELLSITFACERNRLYLFSTFIYNIL